MSGVQRAPRGPGQAHEVRDVPLEQRSIMGEEHVGDGEYVNLAWAEPVAWVDPAAMVLALLSSARSLEAISNCTGQS